MKYLFEILLYSTAQPANECAFILISSFLIFSQGVKVVCNYSVILSPTSTSLTSVVLETHLL